MPRNETPVAKLSRGRGGGWLVESYLLGGAPLFNAAASLQEARAVAKVVAYEDERPNTLLWRTDAKVHYLMLPLD